MASPLSHDTAADVERRQIEGWRAMSPAQKAAAITRLSRAAREMMLAGLRQRHPEATPREIFLRAAIITLGPELAAAAYPEARTLLTS